MKIIVKTTGEFSLLTPDMLEISRKRPHATADEHFVNSRIAKGELKALGRVHDMANDADLGEYWKEFRAEQPKDQSAEDYDAAEALAIEAWIAKWAEKAKAKKKPGKKDRPNKDDLVDTDGDGNGDAGKDDNKDDANKGDENKTEN